MISEFIFGEGLAEGLHRRNNIMVSLLGFTGTLKLANWQQMCKCVCQKHLFTKQQVVIYKFYLHNKRCLKSVIAYDLFSPNLK